MSTFLRSTTQAALLLCSVTAIAQTTPSANSGINQSDTYATMDMSIQNNGTVNLQTPAYNPQTQTTSSSLPANSPTRTFHIEVGYDANGSPVLNLFPTTPGQDPALANPSPVSVIRYANGQLTPFDSSGNVISVNLPSSSTSLGWPLNLPNYGPGSSILAGLLIPRIRPHPLSHSLSTAAGGSLMNIARPSDNSSTMTTQYAQQGSGWALSAMTTTSQDQTGTSTRQVQFSNLNSYDNTVNDAARQANGFPSNLQPYGSNATIPAPPDTQPYTSSTAGTIYSQNNYGGPQNVLFQHGLKSSGAVWGRMTGWLNNDFIFGNEVVTSTAATASLTDQGHNLESLIQNAGGSQYILVGHSQGGLISRFAAQDFSHAARLTSGVSYRSIHLTLARL